MPLLRLRFRLRLTPVGLWAIGGLVSGVLLSSAAIVWTGNTARR